MSASTHQLEYPVCNHLNNMSTSTHQPEDPVDSHLGNLSASTHKPRTTSVAKGVVLTIDGLAKRDLGNRRKHRPAQSHTYNSAEGVTIIKHFGTTSIRSVVINALTVAHARGAFPEQLFPKTLRIF
ncbi:hypothetical protein GW17_00058845 [Ensete ventricosum]|nr:hypothetical protein GW17_00058845 [Ensete ventricosum]